MRGAASPTSRSDRRPTTSTAPIGSAPTCSAPRSCALDARTGKRLWHFQLVHHDLWDLDPSAAPQLTTIRHNGRNRDVVVVASKTTWLYVFDRVTGEPIWPIEERPVPKSEMAGRTELAHAAVSVEPATVCAAVVRRRRHQSRICRPTRPTRSRSACSRPTIRASSRPISYGDTVHIPTSNGGVLFGGLASEPGTGAVYVVTHDNPGILRLLRPGETAGRGGAPPAPPGQAIYQQNCQSCHGPDRLGTANGVPLVHAAADPANAIAAGAPRFDAAAIRAVLERRQGADAVRFRTSRPPTSTRVVTFLTTAPGGRGGGRGAGPLGVGRAGGADRRIRVGGDAARRRGRARAGRAAALSRRCSVVRAAGDQRIQHGGTPHHAALHVDREVRPEPAADPMARRLR